MSNNMSPPIDPYELLNLRKNTDGSITRLPSRWPTVDTNSPSDVAQSKDLPLNQSNATSVRLFRPRQLPEKKLPVIVFFHGGGFIICSAATKVFHDYCCKIAALVPALVVSVEYRLAPEHRLPAAYDDAIEALNWLKSQGKTIDDCDEWIRESADFSNCFLLGSSAGSTMVYYAGLHALDLDLLPVKIQGMIINQAYFGGNSRTESELRLADDKILPLHVIDVMWSLALPLDAGRDHEYCNPMVGSAYERIGRLPRCLVRGYLGDPLVDRQRELVKLLESHGVCVVAKFYDGGCHGADIMIPEHMKIGFEDISDFINFNDNTGESKDGQSVVS